MRKKMNMAAPDSRYRISIAIKGGLSNTSLFVSTQPGFEEGEFQVVAGALAPATT
jgi:hypothetical protein